MENSRDWIIWIYDKTDGSKKPISIEDALNEKYFYSRVTDIHSEIEGKAASVIDLIETKESIDGLKEEDYLIVSKFVSTSRIRTPFFKDVLTNYERVNLEEELRMTNLDDTIAMFNHFFKNNGLPSITKEGYEKHLTSLPDDMRLPIEDLNKTGDMNAEEYIDGEIKTEFLDFNTSIDKIESYAKLFRANFAWILLKSNGVRRFITGDHPVISIGEKDICGIVNIEKNTEAHALCISPSLSLIFIENYTKTASKIVVNEDVVDRINQLIHFQAARFLIAMDEEDLPQSEDMDYSPLIRRVFQIRGLYDNKIEELVFALKMFKSLEMKKDDSIPQSFIKYIKRMVKSYKLYRSWRNSIEGELKKIVTRD